MKTWHLPCILILAVVGSACDQIVVPGAAVPEPASLPMVQASPHTLATGIFDQLAITGLEVHSAGPNTILEQTSTGTVSGTLSGTYEDDIRVVIHPNGNFNAKFTITCQCTVEGKVGTLEFVASDRGRLVSPTLATFEGRAVITGGSGELSGMRGVLAIEGSIDLQSGLSTYSYSGRIH